MNGEDIIKLPRDAGPRGVGQALQRAIKHINELEALNAELVEALRQVDIALSVARTALMKVKLESENEAR